MRPPGRPRGLARRALLGGGLAAAAAGAAAWLAAAAAGWWLDYGDEPVPADLLIVLCSSDYGRAAYAADLFARGLAPEVWLGRSRRTDGERLAESLGVRVPSEWEVFRDVLLKKGVPPERLRLFGAGTLSTFNEALDLRREAGVPGRLLVVTSRYHARRSAMVFRRVFPRSRVAVCASPYEKFTRAWWRDQALARSALLEPAKALYFLLGGGFVASP